MKYPHTLDYFGGVPVSVKSDNRRQWVSKSCKYEPVFTDMLETWANHNHIALLAARPYRPKDKPSVENNVKITYRRIYAALRNDTFYSLAGLNKAIREKLDRTTSSTFRRRYSAGRSYLIPGKRHCCRCSLNLPFN